MGIPSRPPALEKRYIWRLEGGNDHSYERFATAVEEYYGVNAWDTYKNNRVTIEYAANLNEGRDWDRRYLIVAKSFDYKHLIAMLEEWSYAYIS